MNSRAIRLIAGTVLKESLRRREMYVLIFAACSLLALVMSMDFFGLRGLSKFYREISLQVMGLTTAFAVIVLAARQLPRELENRTIYPLLARPIRRAEFLLGKLTGVLLAGIVCFALFMFIFLIGSLRMHAHIPWIHFFQHLYLQILMLAILATLGFLLSMLVNTDAAITICTLLFLLSAISSMMLVNLYGYMDGMGRRILLFLTYFLPQLTLFDFSEKTVHAEHWSPLPWTVLLTLSVYACVYIALYFMSALLLFRRKEL